MLLLDLVLADGGDAMFPALAHELELVGPTVSRLL